MGDWFSLSTNWVFLFIAAVMMVAGVRVVTSRNVVHAVLSLVVALAGSAALFILVGAEFVGWTVVLVYIGAVVVLFLFGIMITRAPLGVESTLSHGPGTRVGAALVAGSFFVLISATAIDGFGDATLTTSPTRTAEVGFEIFRRFVVPFEAISFVLLAALIGGIALARKDPVDGDEAL